VLIQISEARSASRLGNIPPFPHHDEELTPPKLHRKAISSRKVIDSFRPVDLGLPVRIPPYNELMYEFVDDLCLLPPSTGEKQLLRRHLSDLIPT
jgi:hypothetical protein